MTLTGSAAKLNQFLIHRNQTAKIPVQAIQKAGQFRTACPCPVNNILVDKTDDTVRNGAKKICARMAMTQGRTRPPTRRACNLLAAASIALTVTSVVAQSQTDADFYRNRQISIFVGLPAGGSFDAYARLIATHLSKFVPGSPAVIVQNMPGAGSILAANHIYNIAPQDGTVIGAMSSNVPFQPLTDPVGVKYDVLKLNWLPSPAGSISTLTVWHTSPVKTFTDLYEKEALLGTLAPTSSPTVTIGLYKHVLGAKVRAVLGYPGLPSVMLAMERGEVHGYSTIPIDTLHRVYGDKLKAGQLRVLAQNGAKRSTEFPDVPTMIELARNEDDRKLIALGNASGRMTFAYMMGPAVPLPRVELMRSAFDRMFGDPIFRKDAETRQMAIDPVSSAEIETFLREVYATPPEIVKRLKEIVDLQGK